MRKNNRIPKCDKRTVTCDVRIAQYGDETIKYKEKKGNTECDKSTVTCDVGSAQYEDGTVKCEKKKINEPPNVTKVLSHVMLELHNMRMEPSNVRKK